MEVGKRWINADECDEAKYEDDDEVGMIKIFSHDGPKSLTTTRRCFCFGICEVQWENEMNSNAISWSTWGVWTQLV